MAVITLLTDFGTQDEYVGTMKGVILSINPDASIIDITHSIEPQDITQAAYTIYSTYKYFPEKTVHVVVIDPGVGSNRAVVAVRKDQHTFLAPDNGVLTRVLEDDDINMAIKVDNPAYFLQTISRTFHGRDIFSPVAAHITKGIPLDALGSQIDKTKLVRLELAHPQITGDGELMCSIISIDHFGNLITNAEASLVNLLLKDNMPHNIDVCLGQKIIAGLSKSYSEAKPQNPLAIIGSNGYMEIALNCGNAQKYFHAKKGDTVVIRPKKLSKSRQNKLHRHFSGTSEGSMNYFEALFI